jgi:hypothetical protein
LHNLTEATSNSGFAECGDPDGDWAPATDTIAAPTTANINDVIPPRLRDEPLPPPVNFADTLRIIDASLRLDTD